MVCQIGCILYEGEMAALNAVRHPTVGRHCTKNSSFHINWLSQNHRLRSLSSFAANCICVRRRGYNDMQ